MQNICSYTNIDTKFIMRRTNKTIKDCIGCINIRKYSIDSHSRCELIEVNQLVEKSQLYFSGCIHGSYRMLNNSDVYIFYTSGLRDVCKEGYLDVIKAWLNNVQLYQQEQREAQHSLGFDDQYDYNKDLLTNYNIALCYACHFERIDIVKYLISIGANDWNDGLVSACNSGNVELVNFMIHKGATDWNGGIRASATYGKIKITEIMLQHKPSNLSQGLLLAGLHGHIDIAQLLIDNGATDINMGLYGACSFGKLSIVKFMLDKGANSLDFGLETVCRVKSRAIDVSQLNDIIRLLIQRGANECSHCHKSMQEHIE